MLGSPLLQLSKSSLQAANACCLTPNEIMAALPDLGPPGQGLLPLAPPPVSLTWMQIGCWPVKELTVRPEPVQVFVDPCCARSIELPVLVSTALTVVVPAFAGKATFAVTESVQLPVDEKY